MGGFASLLGGMAEPAQSYSHDVRNNQLQIWGTHQKNLMDMLDKSYEAAGTPEARAGILATRGKVSKLRPGDDPSKLLEEAQGWLMPHPSVVQTLTPVEPQKQPGPAQPGSVPGIAQPKPSYFSQLPAPFKFGVERPTNQQDTYGKSMGVNLLGAPKFETDLWVGRGPYDTPEARQKRLEEALAFAEAHTTPSGDYIETAEKSTLPGLSQPSGPPAQPQQAQPQPQGGPMASMLSATAGQQALELYNRFIQAGQIPPEHVRAAAQPYLTNDAELARTRGAMDTKLQYMQKGIDRMKADGTWDKLAPWQQQGYMAEAAGMSAINVPGFAMMPRLLGTNVLGNTGKPDQLDISGNPLDPNTPYRVMEYPMTKEQMWTPLIPPLATAQTEGGVASFNRVTGAKQADFAGAIPPVMNTPKMGATASGGEVQYTPIGVQNGVAPTLIPGVVSPNMMGSQRSTTTNPTVEGGTVTNTSVRRVAPGTQGTNAPSGVNITPVGGASKPALGLGGSNPWSSVRPFDPTKPIDNIVKLIAQDATNEKMIATKGPFSDENPSKAMVNKRLAQLGLDPNNVTGSIRDRVALASTVLPHISSIQGLVDEAEHTGQLGVVMKRWNDVVLNKVGDDPTPNQIITRLASNLSLATTALGMTHGGARAASSLPVIAHWNEVIGAKTERTLKAQLGVVREWLEGYSKMAGPNKDLNLSIPPVGGRGAPPLML
jgi:hypothetical protein